MNVLRSLGGSEYPLNLKVSVLKLQGRVCKDPQMLVDLYVNYDCDLDAPKSVERMVTTLSRIAQGTPSVDPNSVNAAQSGSIKGSSLQCLARVLKSLDDWGMGKSSKKPEAEERAGIIGILKLFEGTDFHSIIPSACFEEINMDLIRKGMWTIEKGLRNDQMDIITVHVVLSDGFIRTPKVYKVE